MAKLPHEIVAEKLQIKRYFYAEYYLLFLFGFDINSREKILYRPWITFPPMISLALVMIGMFHYSFINIQEIDKVVDALSPFIQGTMALWKFIVLIQKRHEIACLAQQFWKLTEDANEAELKILARENKKINYVNLTYCIFMLTTGVLAAGSPLFGGALHYILKGEFVYQTTFTATYPINIEKPLNYFLILILSVWIIFGVICTSAGLETLFSWSSHNIAAQFCVLQHKMVSLSKLTTGATRNDNLIRKSIMDCISFHQRIIKLADDLDQIFNSVALAEYSMNSAQICLLAFIIGRGLDFSRGTYFFSFLVTILIQISMYSYGGQHVENESEQVAIVAYESIDWQLWSIAERKMILLTMLRAQRACKITAVFFDVNLRSFVTVIQTAASYVTLLWSISGT